MHSVIILDEQDSRFKFFSANENINSQILIKDGGFGYNFNADISRNDIGLCRRSDVLLQRLGCEIGKKYYRIAILDPPQLMIYEDNSDVPETIPEAPSSRINYTNHLNQITLTIEK